ncbi:pentapeptide repeat-containing protein [Flavobacterium sp. N1718]|uniref:pentapeptide repeat-containing protein n=1 Tax=Flavobacterium sp. N1718 TaxID=2986822 RepID=UPI002224E139|nr:pentapeptide repeat-containing protein [Flavobacterium sp. N1718]
MTTYVFDKFFSGVVYGRDDLNLTEFEECVFTDCDFTATNCIGLTFISCTFRHCRFDGAQLNHTAYRTVFLRSAVLGDVILRCRTSLSLKSTLPTASSTLPSFMACG